MSENKICDACGNEILSGATECPHCGKKFAPQINNFKFCQHCGKSIDKDCVICPKCGKQVAEISTVQPQIIINNSNVANATAAAGVPVKKKCNKWVSLALCVFFGILGAHKFYEGKAGRGVLYLFTAGLFGIGVLIDFISILCKPNPYYV